MSGGEGGLVWGEGAGRSRSISSGVITSTCFAPPRGVSIHCSSSGGRVQIGPKQIFEQRNKQIRREIRTAGLPELVLVVVEAVVDGAGHVLGHLHPGHRARGAVKPGRGGGVEEEEEEKEEKKEG